MRKITATLLALLSLAGVVTGCEERHAAKCAAKCKEQGLCTAKGDRCVASEAAECRRSQACETKGRCSLAGDDCRATAETCKSFAGCQAAGLCGEKDGVC